MLVRIATKSFRNSWQTLIGGTLIVVLGAAFWSGARAQSSAQATCVPGSGADWMLSSDLMSGDIDY